MGYNGDQILKTRKSIKLSRRRLSNALEVSQRTIARWENGQVEPGRIALLAVFYLRDMGAENRKEWTQDPEQIVAPAPAPRMAVPQALAPPKSTDPFAWWDDDGNEWSRDSVRENYYEPNPDDPEYPAYMSYMTPGPAVGDTL